MVKTERTRQTQNKSVRDQSVHAVIKPCVIFIRRVEPAYVNISVGWGKIGVEIANTFKMPPKLQLKLSCLVMSSRLHASDSAVSEATAHPFLVRKFSDLFYLFIF